MAEIHYLDGDATEPIGEGKKFIIHVCNDAGGWGAGFVLALSAKWDAPEKSYREWFNYSEMLGRADPDVALVKDQLPLWRLGEVQLVLVEPDIYVANIIGQHGYSGIPIRYDALLTGLRQVAREAKTTQATIHAPRLGCGLAGGDWRIVAALLEVAFVDEGIDVYVYDYG